jgi:hypothetical protein
VARRRLDPVEGDLEHDPRLDEPDLAVGELLQRVRLEPFGKLVHLSVGQAGVGLADVEQGRVAFARAHGERVVAQEPAAAPFADLGGGDHDVERGQRPLDLEPIAPPAARLVRRARVLHQQSFVAPRPGRRERVVQSRNALVLFRGGPAHDLPIDRQRFQERAPRGDGSSISTRPSAYRTS